MHCACFAPRGRHSQEAEAVSRPAAARVAGPRTKKRRSMLSRIVKGLTRSEEEEEQYETASEGEGSPPRLVMEDGGHLTARSSVSGGGHSRRGSAGAEASNLSRPLSRRVSAASEGGVAPLPPSGGGSPADGGGPAAGQGRWGAVLGGVPFLPGIPFLSTMLSPRQTSEEREAAVAAAQEAHLVAQQQAQQAAGSGGSPGAAAALDWQQRPSSSGAGSGGGSSRYPAATAQPGEEDGGSGGRGGASSPRRDLSGSTAGGSAAAAPAELDELALERDTTPPTLLQPGNAPPPELSEPSALLSEAHLRALVAVLPARHRQAKWSLAYSTHRDGISLSTLLRSCRGRAPTVLLVRDMGRFVFGAYCSEAWRPAQQRYYGTGETFVFQLEPRQVAWFWWWQKMSRQRNDFFMWGGQDSIAVGGAGGYALWLDSELARGLSRSSATFGNDSLASCEEFQVGAVELWCLG